NIGDRIICWGGSDGHVGLVPRWVWEGHRNALFYPTRIECGSAESSGSCLRHQIANVSVDALAHEILIFVEPAARLSALRKIIADYGQDCRFHESELRAAEILHARIAIVNLFKTLKDFR